ncbi:MAG: type II toxin-antitoxin system Phd/YefM family antitoxin [Tepidisphaeraceae bacterium]
MPVAKRRFSRSDLDTLMDRALEEDGAVIIKRPGHRDVALIPVEKLRHLDTTDYLLASPGNRRRLRAALRRARAGKPRVMTVAQLRKDVGLDA